MQTLLPTTTTNLAASPGDERGAVNADINDSDAFFQPALRVKPARDNTRRIEALLARMTLEEKVGQMTRCR